MDVVVFGAGSLGSLVGGLLAAEHEVTIVGRSPHVDVVATDGIRVTGLLQRRATPRATTDIDVDRADLAIVTVKAYDTAAAASALSDCELGAVLSLQNGMGNEETLGGRLPCPVLAGATTFGARLIEPGTVECTGVGSVTLGTLPGIGSGSHDGSDVATAFQRADVETHLIDDMRPVLWEKLAVNAGINPVTALAGVENGAVRHDPLRPVAERAAAEVANVAQTVGVGLSESAAQEALHEVADATAANRSSMLQDVEAGRRTEIDAICGYPVDRAGDSIPVTRTLAGLVRGWESARGLR